MSSPPYFKAPTALTVLGSNCLAQKGEADPGKRVSLGSLCARLSVLFPSGQQILFSSSLHTCCPLCLVAPSLLSAIQVWLGGHYPGEVCSSDYTKWPPVALYPPVVCLPSMVKLPCSFIVLLTWSLSPWKAGLRQETSLLFSFALQLLSLGPRFVNAQQMFVK